MKNCVHPTARFAIKKGTDLENVTYCSKDNTKIAGPWEHGEHTEGQGKRNDIHDLKVALKKKRKLSEIAEEMPEMIVKYPRGVTLLAACLTEDFTPDGMRGIWYVGAPGTGKSRTAREEYTDLYNKSQNKWFDGYQGEKAILIDDLDRGGACLSHYLKIWADRYSCQGEVKGGTVKLQHTHLIVTSNYTIEDLWAEDPILVDALKRRFSVKHFRSLM